MILRTKPSISFWAISIVFLLWNLAGLAAFLLEAVAPELLTETFNDAQMAQYNSRPGWYMYNFAVAVFAGTLAAVLLLLRKKFALVLAVISLVAVIISTVYTVSSGGLDIVETTDKVLFYSVLIIDVIMVIFTRHAISRRWIV